MLMRAQVLLLLACLPAVVLADRPAPLRGPDYSMYSDEALKEELKQSAVDERVVLVPMRDGVGLSTNMFRPKDAKGPLPIILWKTPYSELGMQGGGAQRYVLAAIKRGYAFVVQNERGRYFSEGKYEILGHPQTDGYDALSWIAKQPWSNGKVGTLGCSSSAEWQLALAAQNHPAHAAMVPMAAGAGIGKVGRFQEQGNWYRGGVPRILFFVWLYGVDNPLRAQLPVRPRSEDPRAHRRATTISTATKPDVDWSKQIQHLPVAEMLTDLGEPPGTFEELIARTPADPAWYKGGLYHDDMDWGVPALWFNSWYDVSIGPNWRCSITPRRRSTDAEARANQYAIIAPVTHCSIRSSVPTPSRRPLAGRRELRRGWQRSSACFDRCLKGEKHALPVIDAACPLLHDGRERVEVVGAVAAEAKR